MDALEQIEYNKALELKEKIEGFKYHEMKQEFEKMGIGEVFKPGMKKELLVSAALVALEQLNSTGTIPEVEKDIQELDTVNSVVVIEEKQELSTEEEKSEIITISETISEIEVVEPIVLQKQYIVIEEKAILVEKPQYSREVIEENLELIQCSLHQALPTTRIMLFEKQAKLLLMLDQWDEYESYDNE